MSSYSHSMTKGSYSEYLTKGRVTGIMSYGDFYDKRGLLGIMVVLTYFFWGTPSDTRGLNPIPPIGYLFDVPLISNTTSSESINHKVYKV